MRHSQRQILRLSLEKLCELLGSGQRGPPIDLKFLPSCCNPESHLASSMLREVLCNLGQGLNQDHRVRDRHMQLFSSTNPPAPGSDSAQCILNRTAALHLRQAAQQISPFCISTRLVDGEELVQNRLSSHPSTCHNVLPHRFRERSQQSRARPLIQSLEPWGHLLLHLDSQPPQWRRQKPLIVLHLHFSLHPIPKLARRRTEVSHQRGNHRQPVPKEQGRILSRR